MPDQVLERSDSKEVCKVQCDMEGSLGGEGGSKYNYSVVILYLYLYLGVDPLQVQ